MPSSQPQLACQVLLWRCAGEDWCGWGQNKEDPDNQTKSSDNKAGNRDLVSFQPLKHQRKKRGGGGGAGLRMMSSKMECKMNRKDEIKNIEISQEVRRA